MYGQDKTLVCADCNQEFSFTASEQQFFAERQFSEPRRCPSCRAARKARVATAVAATQAAAAPRRLSGGRLLQRPARDVQRHLLELRPRAQVPFRPSGAKPVYCSDCFIPLKFNDNVVGVMNLSKSVPDGFTPSELRLLGLLPTRQLSPSSMPACIKR